MNLLLELRDADEELFQVGCGAGDHGNHQTVVVSPVLLHILRGSDTFYKITASFLSNLAEISVPVRNLIDIKEDLKSTAKVDSETSEQGLPECILLGPLSPWHKVIGAVLFSTRMVLLQG